jgi:hypothetical protein
VELYSSIASLTDCRFEDFPSGWYALVFDTLDKFPILSGNSGAGTGYIGIAVPGGEVGLSSRWNKPGTNFPYFLNGGLQVPEAATLTLDPGVTVKTEGGWVYVYGTLLAQGTETDPVTFASRNANPVPGQWYGIYYGPKAGKSGASYLTVMHAGLYRLHYLHDAYRLTSIYIDGSSPQFDHLRVSDSANNGVEIWQSNSRFQDLAIDRCAGYGFKAEYQSRPLIRNAVFRGNGTGNAYTVGMDASCVPNLANTQFETNSYQGIQIWGGTLSASGRWQNWSTNAPYVITEDVTVGEGVWLQIEAGTTIKVANRGWYI